VQAPAEKTKPQMPVPEVSQTAIHTSNGSHITHIDLAVKPVEIAAGADGSRNRADEVIGWLRSYASDRINSRLIDERRCIPPYVVLDFGNRGILGMQVS
jgi:hypothetical protein